MKNKILLLLGMMLLPSALLAYTQVPININLTNGSPFDQDPIQVNFTLNPSNLKNVDSWEGGHTFLLTATPSSTPKPGSINLINNEGKPISGTIEVQLTASLNGYSPLLDTETITLNNNQLPSTNPYQNCHTVTGPFSCCFGTNYSHPYSEINVICETGNSSMLTKGKNRE